MGWRIFEGLSLTGKPMEDVMCPVHSGCGSDPGLPTAADSWDVSCMNCYWYFLDEFMPGDPVLLSAADAVAAAKQHIAVCEVKHKEPVFEFKDQDDFWYGQNDPVFQTMVQNEEPGLYISRLTDYTASHGGATESDDSSAAGSTPPLF